MYLHCFSYCNRSQIQHGQCLHLYTRQRDLRLDMLQARRTCLHKICTSVVTLPCNFLRHNPPEAMHTRCFIQNHPPVCPVANSAICWKRCHIHAHSDTSSTRYVLFHSVEWLHSLWFNGHFVGCKSILFHPVVHTGKITCSGLIHKIHRTTLESLLQFELSNHNGRMRLPFFPCCVYVCLCVHVG